MQHRNVEPGEVHQLDDDRVGQQALEVRAVEAVPAERRRHELHQVRLAVAGGKLHQAEPVAVRLQAHRLGIDRDHGAERQALRQVVPVQMDGAARHELNAAHSDH